MIIKIRILFLIKQRLLEYMVAKFLRGAECIHLRVGEERMYQEEGVLVGQRGQGLAEQGDYVGVVFNRFSADLEQALDRVSD